MNCPQNKAEGATSRSPEGKGCCSLSQVMAACIIKPRSLLCIGYGEMILQESSGWDERAHCLSSGES